jgi:hypothetical protein
MSIFEVIAERRIEEAMARGEFDNLSCAGKPIPPDDLIMVPEEMRMAYKILKNAGIIPEEIELRKSIYSMNELLKACVNEEEKKQLRLKLNEKQLRYNMIMETRGLKKLDLEYQDKIMDKLNK